MPARRADPSRALFSVAPSLEPQEQNEQDHGPAVHRPVLPVGLFGESRPAAEFEWRYRDQIDWQLVTIGLSDPVESPEALTRRIRPGLVEAA